MQVVAESDAFDIAQHVAAPRTEGDAGDVAGVWRSKRDDQPMAGLMCSRSHRGGAPSDSESHAIGIKPPAG